VFSFSRFRQTFASGIVKNYYDVLSLRNTVENDLRNIERLKETFAMTRTLVKGGQVSRIQQDQAEQNLLNAQVRLEAARQAYYIALDRFKITLGLPISTKLVLDYPAALDELQKIGTKPIPFNEKQAVQTALSTRTNLLSARASVRDADKEVEIATDNFLPRLDLELGISSDSPNHKSPLRLQTHRHTRTARLIFNYPLDQADNRDSYRNAMIAFNKSKRDLEESEDNVQLDVINSFRSLQRSQISYGLQQQSVAIAKRRTKLAALQQEQGEASTRDVLEAEEAFRDAMNGLVNSLTRYTTTRLDFLAELGMIDVDSKGNITERKAPFGFDRLQQLYPYLDTRRPVASEGQK
jgi:outer membrane protein TolC